MSRTTCENCGVYAVAYLGDPGEARYECPECGEEWDGRRPVPA